MGHFLKGVMSLERCVCPLGIVIKVQYEVGRFYEALHWGIISSS